MLRILKIVRARALAPSDAPAMGISIYICVVANIGGAVSPASKRVNLQIKANPPRRH